MEHDKNNVLARIKNIVHDWVEVVSLNTVEKIGLDKKTYDDLTFFKNDDELDEYMEDLYTEERGDHY